MTPTDLSIPASDGFPLAATLWDPKRAKGTVLLNSATAVRRQYYRHFGAFLGKSGWRVLTYDYRGIGGSRPERLRGYDATLSDWADLDFAGACRWLEEQEAPRPRVAIGHSFGGQALGLTELGRHFDALVLIAAQSGYWGHWRGLGRARMLATWYLLFPLLLGLFDYIPGWAGMGQDLPGEVAREWRRWCLHPSYGFGFRPRAEALAAELARPLMAVSIDDDEYAPRPAVDWLVERFNQARVHRVHWGPADAEVPTVGHFGVFQSAGRKLWPRVEAWASSATGASAAP